MSDAPKVTAGILAKHCAESLRRLAAERPRVHCITNAVAVNVSANALLAVGARPSMTYDPGEAAGFAASADALCINLGTLDEMRRRAIPLAVEAARTAGRPWVLDPVMIGASETRRAFAEDLLDRRPSVVRGNAAEIALLAPEETAAAVAMTGPEDVVTDGRISRVVRNGHRLMDRVTAMGCAESAVIAAFLAVARSPFDAALQGIVVFNVAGEIAGERATGPGSFEPALLDSLYALTETQLAARISIE